MKCNSEHSDHPPVEGGCTGMPRAISGLQWTAKIDYWHHEGIYWTLTLNGRYLGTVARPVIGTAPIWLYGNHFGINGAKPTAREAGVTLLEELTAQGYFR